MSETSGRIGLGFKSRYYDAVLQTKPDIGWLEVHAENFFCGGYHRKALREARKHYPVSIHAVGLSLGSVQAVDKQHLEQLAQLVDETDPLFVSDHASWSHSGNVHLNDLLPLPYNEESLQALCDNISRVQDRLKRSILIENPSTYLEYTLSNMSEPQFLYETVTRTGCELLLDVNNIFVQAHNHGFSAEDYLKEIPAQAVKEIHVAGHIERQVGERTLLVDTHSKPVRPEVWSLYEKALARFGAIHTLVEWDTDLPELDTLLAETKKAAKYISNILKEEYRAAG